MIILENTKEYKDTKLAIPVGVGVVQTESVKNFYNTSDADATSADILIDKTAYGKYGKLTGTLDLDAEKEISYQDGYETGKTDGYDSGYSIGYDAGEDAGIEIGKNDIINGMNDATITAETVFKGEIGYGKNNERIVGEFEFVEGFDFEKIGYNKELSNEINNDLLEKIDYSKQLMDEWNPATTNASRYFQDDLSLIYAPLVDTSNVTNMSYFLYQCPNLQVIPDYNYDKVTNMQNFCSYSGNKSLNLDLKSCTSASMIASYNTSINNASINFNNTECNCYGMFYNCSNLENVNIKNVNSTSCSNTFYGCQNLTTITFENFNVTSTCDSMFSSCQKLTTVPLFDTSNVTTMASMFSYCQKLTTVPLFDTSNVTSMTRMFYSCYRLTSLPLFDTSNVTSMLNAFGSCNLSEFPSLNTSNVTNIDGFIRDNSNLITIHSLNLQSVNVTGGLGTWNGFDSLPNLENVVALNNFGQGFSGTANNGIYLTTSTKLTRQSCLNIFNTIYDMTLNTSYTGTPIIKLSSTTKALLSDDDIAIASAKGWTVQA